MDKLCCFKVGSSRLTAQSSSTSGKGKSSQSSIKVTYGYSLVKGRTNHPIEDYHVSKFTRMKGKELGLFAIFDGHLGDSVPSYLQKHLFANILKEQEFWTHPDRAISKAYDKTDNAILSHSSDLGRGGSTAVTAILINGQKLWVANVGDSRGVLAKGGRVVQMTVDHEPSTERGSIENRGGFVSNMPGHCQASTTALPVLFVYVGPPPPPFATCLLLLSASYLIINTSGDTNSMISAICWVPKGASKVTPVVAEPPSKEEIEEILKNELLERSGDSDAERDDHMEVETSKNVEEVAHALAVAEALGEVKNMSDSLGFGDISDGLRELNMDQYDDEDDGIELFGSGMGDAYYPSNEMDPYLNKNDDDGDNDDDDDDDEAEDLTIKPTDAVIVCARCEDEVGHLEIWVYEELENETNMYVHHDIILPAFPLCTTWLDCDPKNGDKGNFVAVGSMDIAIEIWDLDLLDEVQPSVILGGTVEKKKRKKSSVKYKKGSHRDSVLGLAWNKEVRNVLASASGDKTVKIWDVVTAQCALTLNHHSDKVQAVEWHHFSPEVLLSGSFDRSVVMMDMKSNGLPANKWVVTSDVESIKWDPHNEHFFVVSLDDGTVQGYDVRTASMDSDSRSKACFTLHAHDEACCSLSYNPSAPNLLATGSKDKMVKLWDLSNNQPSCVASRNPKTGAVFTMAFSEDCPFSLAIGGSKGKLKVWDTLSEDSVYQKYGKFSDRKMTPKPEA